MEVKDKEVQMLREQLQLREMELAKLKLANLKEKIFAGNSVTSTTTRESFCPIETVYMVQVNSNLTLACVSLANTQLISEQACE